MATEPAGKQAAAVTRIGVDIGGTFTDIIVVTPNGRLRKHKLPSTPDDYARGIIDGIAAVLGAGGPARHEDVGEIVHATTVATNAILERRGARTALVTTEGFRDVLELRRIRIPLSYDLGWEKPPPLVERALRFEVPERLDNLGKVLKPLDEDRLADVIDQIEGEAVEAVAVCLLHAYRDPAHENRIADELRARLPDVHVSVSSAVLPEIQEFERTSTTVVNAYVAPLISRYLGNLRRRLDDAGVAAPFLVMQSNGGLMPAATAAERPVTIIESGPAAGVVAAARVAREAGYENVITLDMGGTTTKASIIERGEILRARDYEVGGEVSLSSRLVRGGGYLLRIPVIDISEVGAGGGSIAMLDAAGALRVGPTSAGAVPGPACYAHGNDRPTVTDANLVLGFLHDGSLAGGALTVHRERAEHAIAEHVAAPTGLSLLDAADGIHRIANSNMVRAIKSVSVERGRDPADFSMVAFGGAGPIHAARLADALNIHRVIVPPAPGLLSAFGLLHAEVEHHTARTVLAGTGATDLPIIQSALDEMKRALTACALDEGYDADSLRFSALADMRYAGQSSELLIPLATLTVDEAALRTVEDMFESEYRRLYGHVADHRHFELVNCHVVATVRRDVADAAEWEDIGSPRGYETAREVYFGPDWGLLQASILARSDLRAQALAGPIIIEEYDSTVVVPPQWEASVDTIGNILLTMTDE